MSEGLEDFVFSKEQSDISKTIINGEKTIFFSILILLNFTNYLRFNMVRSKVTITMEGDLPYEAFSKKYKSLIEKRIQGDVLEQLGEYEIRGEFFGDDERIYALFLNGVELVDSTDEENPNEQIGTLEARIKTLNSELQKTKKELDSHRSKPEKYSLGELNVRYTALPFCEHCGEGYDEFGVEIEAPNGGTSWCLPCFTTDYELCEQDMATINKTMQRKEKAHYKKKLKK